MRRLALLPGLALLLSFMVASSARADQPAGKLRAFGTRNVRLPQSLRLTPLREFGLAGLNLRLRIPGPIAPYVEGRLGDGVSADRPDGALMIHGTPIGVGGAIGAGGSGLVAARGVDLGVDVRRFKGGYVSVALGLLRTSWAVGGLDDRDRLVATHVSADGAVLKVGVSF
jgi:hypothetical protein